MKRRLFLLILILAILILAEFAARKSYGDGFLSLLDPKLHHARRPYIDIERTWGTGEKFRLITNSLGWRDEASFHNVAKLSARKRIVFLGDSITEAIGYDQELSFSGIAKRILREKTIDCEVLNAGTASYSPLLEYVRLKRFLDNGYKTDIVLLLPDLSDVQDEVLYTSWYIFDKDNQPVKFANFPYRYSIACAILNSACLVRLTAASIKNFYDSKIKANLSRKAEDNSSLSALSLAEQSHVRGNWELDHASLSGWAKEGLRLLESNISRIKRLCDENNILLIVVIYPWPQQLYTKENPKYYKVLKDYFRDLYQARQSFYGTKPSETPSLYERTIASFCRRQSIKLLNLFDEFAEMSEPHILYIENDIHFNKIGHAFLGEKIAQVIMEIL